MLRNGHDLIVNPAVYICRLKALHNKTQLKYTNKQNTQQTAAESTAASQNQEVPAGLKLSSQTASYRTKTEHYFTSQAPFNSLWFPHFIQSHNNTYINYYFRSTGFGDKITAF